MQRAVGFGIRMTEHGKKLLFDCVFILCVLCFALLTHLTSVSPQSGGTRHIVSDAQQLVSFAAALDHPEAFSRDPLLADPRNFGWYKSLHVPLIRLLANGKDYGEAYEKLTGIHQFLHLAGFYLLGVFLLRRRLLAAAFAVFLSLEFWFGWGTYWGSMRASVPLPRVGYAALFSLLCAAMLRARRRCVFWPFIFLGMGALVYVHAISALGMGFAMWLGLWHLRPPGFGVSRHIRRMILAALCFLLPAAPFIANFLHYAAAPLSPEDLLFLREIAAYRIAETFTRLGPQLWDFLVQICTRPPLLPAALLGIFITRRYGSEEEKELIPLLGLWTLGIVLTVCAFAADQATARLLGRLPLEYDMIRCIRFIPFFCCIAAFTGVSVLTDSEPFRNRAGVRFLPAGLAGAAFALFLLQGITRPVLFLFLPPTPEWEETLAKERADGELVRALVSHTEPGSKIFLEGGDYLVRYGALRNLAFSHKDGVILLYAKQVSALKKWYGPARALEDDRRLGAVVNPVEDAREGAAGDAKNASSTLLKYARRTDSDYLVLRTPEFPLLPKEAGERIWNNSRYVMLHLTGTN
jgi:hypothetical protein